MWLSDIGHGMPAPKIAEEIVSMLHDHALARTAAGPVLALSSKTLFELRMAPGFAWRDRVRSDEELEAGELAHAMGIGDESDDVADEDVEGEIREMLETLQDFLPGGAYERGHGIGRDRRDGPPFAQGPLWGSPFSEN